MPTTLRPSEAPVQSPPATAPVARLRGASKTFREGSDEHRVLRGVDLEIYPGEMVALLGRSGSGKSTLLNLLAGIDLASEGEVLLGDRDLGAMGEHQRTLLRRHEIGFVFQFFNLIPTLTVEENILLPLELAGRLTPEQRQRALEPLDDMGLLDRLGSYPDVLSGGEQQRVAIARALAHDPKIILADEPTGNLDEDTAEQVLELLVHCVRQRHKTLVVATHSREVAERADRVLRLRDGSLAPDP